MKQMSSWLTTGKFNKKDEYYTPEILKLLKEKLAQAEEEYDKIIEEAGKAFKGKDKKEIHKYQLLLNKHRYYCLGIYSAIHAIEMWIDTRKENSYIEEAKE